MKSVCDLGVQLDTELSMQTHVSKVASSCLYQLRRLRQITRLVGQEVAAYSVSQKKSPLRFSEIFSQMVGDF